MENCFNRPGATVDTWIAGGVQFAGGAAYSYVVLIGTGSTREPWSRNLHASQVGTPLLEALLDDLKEHAKRQPVAVAAARPATGGASGAAPAAAIEVASQKPAAGGAAAKPSPGWSTDAFRAN